jgi:hypothetical protein
MSEILMITGLLIAMTLGTLLGITSSGPSEKRGVAIIVIIVVWLFTFLTATASIIQLLKFYLEH